jgi:anhydro-N-acetylmuramic acid kinase
LPEHKVRHIPEYEPGPAAGHENKGARALAPHCPAAQGLRVAGRCQSSGASATLGERVTAEGGRVVGASGHFRSSRLAVGLMSGTSLDGVDAALVRISGPAEKPAVRLLSFVNVPYSPALRLRLLKVAGGAACGAAEISRLNFALGEAFAAAALRVCRQGRISPQRVAFIGSHGQTVFHQGPRRPFPGVAALSQAASTLQIGEPAIIAARTGAPVVADFRPADLAVGGQGAPLVPLVDYLLLRHKRYGIVALNIGGIANVTVIPARATPQKAFGFDTGPGNMVIDALVQHFTRGRKSYDTGGRLAAQGRVIKSLVARVLGLPFFRRKPPKSAGREQFGRVFVARHFLRRRFAAKDLLRTATELTARSIVDALERFVFPRVEIHRLVVSGGGAHNRLLLSRLTELLPHLSVRLSDDHGLPRDAKEAIAFAVLADRTLRGLPGNLPAATGADRAVVLGKIVQCHAKL